MNTRTEIMNNKKYCAYCGKELKDYGNCFVHTYPETPVICDCEKAKRELELYDELKELYNAPLAESLIDMKVKEYRDKLLGVHIIPTTATITKLGGNPISINSGEISDYTTYANGCVCLD